MTENEPALLFQGLRDPEMQAAILREYFPHLQFNMDLIDSIELPPEAEEFLLLPDPLRLWPNCTYRDYYSGSVEMIMNILRQEQRKALCISSSYMLSPGNLNRSKEILTFYQKLRKAQPGNIFMVPVKISAYAKMSARAALDAIGRSETSEIGFGAYENLIAYLTHIDYPPFYNSTVRANCLGDVVFGRHHIPDYVPSLTFRKRDFGLKNRKMAEGDSAMVNFTIVETDIAEAVSE